MTDSTRRRCRWCGSIFAAGDGPGRKPEFCRRSHRQRAYEARRQAEHRGLGANEVLIDRTGLQILNDRLYVLEAAVEDVEGDLAAGATTIDDYRDAVVHLIEAAVSLRNSHLEPKAAHLDSSAR